VAVRADAAVPDVSTPHALRSSLLAAKSLAYGDPAKGDSSGIHFAKVLERLELGKAVGAKTVLAPLGLAVAELVESGEVEMGVTRASVILACKGTKLAGLLPAELQHATTYAAAMMAGSGRADEAKRFLAHIASPAAKSTFKMAGFDQNV
jgi:molybdate transport system substrate-binding protein